MRNVVALFVISTLISLNLCAQTLRIGYYDNPPLSLRNSGKPAGIVPDILNVIAENNDWNLQYHFFSFSEALEALNSNEIDILCVVAHSNEREGLMEFNEESIISNWGEIYSKKNNLIESVLDLDEKKVAILSNDVYYKGPKGMKKFSDDFNLSIDFVEVEDYLSGMKAVKSGSADAVLTNHLYGMFEVADRNLIPANIFLNPVQLYFAFPKGKNLNQILIPSIDTSLYEMKSNGNSQYYKIIKKYTGSPEDKKMLEWMIYLAIIFGILAFLVWINNLILKRKVTNKTRELLDNNRQLEKTNNTIKSLLKNTQDMISLISEVGQPEVSEEEFMRDLLNIALKMVPVADAGSASLIEESEWRFVAAAGHDFEKLRKIPLKKEFVHIPDKISIFENIHNINNLYIPKAEYRELLKATSPIKYTMVTPLKVSKKSVGFLSLDITRYSTEKFSNEYRETMEALALLASSYLANKMSARTQYETQLSLVKSLVELVETRDTYTRGHSERVARYAREIASHLFKDEEKLNNLYLAGLLHDIGKIVIDDKILNKPDSLTVYEIHTMMEHPETGYRVLNASPQLRPTAGFVKYHHERWDGKGYPEKLKGKEIPMEARILTVADSFDAMLSERPYRESSMTLEQAIEELKKNSGTQFDPMIVNLLICLINSKEILLGNSPDESVKVIGKKH